MNYELHQRAEPPNNPSVPIIPVGVSANKTALGSVLGQWSDVEDDNKTDIEEGEIQVDVMNQAKDPLPNPPTRSATANVDSINQTSSSLATANVVGPGKSVTDLANLVTSTSVTMANVIHGNSPLTGHTSAEVHGDPGALALVQIMLGDVIACQNSGNRRDCCQPLLGVCGVALAQRLKDTSLFQLPDLNTSEACLHDFQSKLDSLSLPSDLAFSCFGNPERSVITPVVYAGIQTNQDWINKLGPTTHLDFGCLSDLYGSSCDACVSAGFKVLASLMAIDCNTSYATDCWKGTEIAEKGAELSKKSKLFAEGTSHNWKSVRSSPKSKSTSAPPKSSTSQRKNLVLASSLQEETRVEEIHDLTDEQFNGRPVTVSGLASSTLQMVASTPYPPELSGSEEGEVYIPDWSVRIVDCGTSSGEIDFLDKPFRGYAWLIDGGL
ncbi:hypothetical protein NE237_012309 [Protea cynaroides]|uniref:SPARK domain-containing protein n=1 Tax=Protea cynaroides TaxID=273540 RepID=A0A9Q0GYV9_9MAGN|nr:hypothetical protein NE237_012309 [Protea cynaroides]